MAERFYSHEDEACARWLHDRLHGQGIRCWLDEHPLLPGAKPAKDDRASSRRLLQDAEVFHAFAAAGKRLAELHIGYEQQPEFPLHRCENHDAPLNWRAEKMHLSKGKSALAYNGFLTLDGIPPETYEYRLGNRSALKCSGGFPALNPQLPSRILPGCPKQPRTEVPLRLSSCAWPMPGVHPIPAWSPVVPVIQSPA